MITLKVEEYCHNCEDFTPDIKSIYADNRVIETRISCLLSARCARLRDRQEKHEKAEFACRVCQKIAKRNYPNSLGCPWREIDGEYCDELAEEIRQKAEAQE